jgi:hypothetical protein
VHLRDREVSVSLNQVHCVLIRNEIPQLDFQKTTVARRQGTKGKFGLPIAVGAGYTWDRLEAGRGSVGESRGGQQSPSND